MWLSIPCRLPQLLRISCLLWNITECDKTTVWHERQFKIHILFFLWIQWPAISICARDVDWKGGQSIRAGGLKINATIQYSTAEWAHEEIPQQLGITRIFSNSSRIKLPLIVLGLSVPRVLLRLHHITTREWHSTQVPYPRSAPVPSSS